MESIHRAAIGRIVGIACLLAWIGCGDRIMAQDLVRAWGGEQFASDTFLVPTLDLATDGTSIAVLRSDQRVVAHGRIWLPDLPAGSAPRMRVAIGWSGAYVSSFGLALRNDGTIEGWGDGVVPTLIPPLPPFTTYIDVVAASRYAIALRSDRVAVLWSDGLTQATLPPVPVGVPVLEIHAAPTNVLLRLGNGAIVASGNGPLAAVPPLPPGTTYTGMWAGNRHAIAVRSDGVYVAWGENDVGQGSLDQPPAGVVYETFGLGFAHTVAVRSDGVLVGWGDNGFGQLALPTLPSGSTVAQIVATLDSTFVRLGSGQLLVSGRSLTLPLDQPPLGEHWGALSAGAPNLALTSGGALLQVPFASGQPAIPLPTGVHYTAVAAGAGYDLVLRSDGRVVAWGSNYYGQSTIPPLPPGLEYERIAAEWVAVLLRSDGVACLTGSAGTQIAPPSGRRFVRADTNGQDRLILLCDDGTGRTGVTNPSPLPTLPSGVRYVDVRCGSSFYAGLRSDGEIDVWDSQPTTVPPLPPGTHYVAIAAGSYMLAARRSDGQVVVTGNGVYPSMTQVPPLASGESWLEVSCGYDWVLGRIGPTSTYVTFAPGCAGSQPAARLVPADTPRIGVDFEVRLFDLPHDLAVLAFGWQPVGPIMLDGFGMPGCALAVALDALVPVAGSGGQAVHTLPIPASSSLVGVAFDNQAAVFDAAANPMGLVLSDAAHGVIGRP